MSRYDRDEFPADFRPSKKVRTMEIIGVDGKVHYRRPEGHPLIQEALSRGLTVREQESD